MQIVFEKLIRKNIFCEEFKSLTENNCIDFNANRIAIIYGPNGTGKTSLAKALSQDHGTEYTISIDGQKHTEKDLKIAHVINDQNDRNIIQGSTEDFILGDNIRREYELKRQIEDGFRDSFEQKLILMLKSRFGISVKGSPLETVIKDAKLKTFISDLANAKSKGKKIDRSEFITYVTSLKRIEIQEHNEDKFKFFVNDYKEKESVIRKFQEQSFVLIKEEKQLLKIEESSEAVRILEKYDYLDECLVCDTDIDRDVLLTKKNTQKKFAFESLSEETKKIVEEIIKKVPNIDPFGLAEVLNIALKSGDSKSLAELKIEIKSYSDIYSSLINNLFIDSLSDNLVTVFLEYTKLTKEKPQFESEDIIFIEKFLNDCLDRKITLTRDDDNNLKLLLGDDEFLNHVRVSLSLSNGEQNFLSLAFELLKAKKAEESIVVLDDPISSFDSIYKNKIAYSILKILSDKKALILTHNTDLIKLLEHQQKKCFSLYYLNNTKDEVNGFIFINSNELEILLYIHVFLDLLRGDIKAEIIDEKAFLISIIPFMRGYCQIINNIADKNLLTKIMHGYETTNVNLGDIYSRIFAHGIIEGVHDISVADIVKMDVDGLSIIKGDKFPLLSKTLNHTFTYLYLRLTVEKELVEKYKVNTKKYDMLSNIITESFKGKDQETIHNRVFFLSRKTLLNEFNHFEMDMNIFQPAIDITNQALNKEKTEILQKLQAMA
jgi:ABC-type Mn2+/Zn2+ transport system ATPase subunit